MEPAEAGLFCDIYEPVYIRPGDSLAPETEDELLGNNSTFFVLCEGMMLRGGEE